MTDWQPLVAELDRVVALEGVWINSPPVSAPASPAVTGVVTTPGSAEVPASIRAQLESAFPVTYVGSYGALHGVLDAPGLPQTEASSSAGDTSLSANLADDRAVAGQVVVVRARTRIAWLDALGSEAGRASWLSTGTVGASKPDGDERGLLLEEISLLRAELERPMYQLVRRVRRVAERLPGALGVLRWAWHTLSGIRRSGATLAGNGPKEVPDDVARSYPLRDRWMLGAPPREGRGRPAQLSLVLREPDAGRQGPLVSIVVLSFNNGALTLDCLRHIWAHTEGARYEVVVVENGSHPSEALPLQPYRGQFRYVPLTVNRFFGEGNNIGAEAAQGEILVFLNNDAMVCEGWLEPLVAAVSRPEVGAAGARLLFSDGRVQETGALLRRDGSALQLEKGVALDQVPASGEASVDYCSAACLALRTDLFRRVGGFDLCWEPAYYEDTDLCFKIRAQGLAVVCARKSRVVHLEHATTSRRFRDLDLRGQPEFNQRKFMDRWGPVLRGEVPITEYGPAVILEASI